MRTIVILAFLFVFALGQAQDSVTTDVKNKTDLYELQKPATYKLKNQDFTFTPGENSIRIKKLNDQEEVDFGLLRKTTDDGLYIMTSTLNEDVSFGRFDSKGNFRTLRYDQKKDSVLEDLYEMRDSTTQKVPKR